MLGQNDGIENEKNLVEAFDEKRIAVLSAYQKRFLHQLYGSLNDDSIVYAKKVGGQGYKPDIQFSVGGKAVNVSVKKGTGNSVHQEKTDYFVHYCMKSLDMTEEERNCLLEFLYGDGTLDGDSAPEDRLSDAALEEEYKEQITTVQDFLDRNRRNLLERFLIYGRLGKENNIKADYIYHGDANEGVWCPLNYTAIDYLASLPNSPDAPLSIGPLTLQVWNRNLEGKPQMENRRHSIQVKWSGCKNHVQNINELYLEQKQNSTSISASERVLGNNRQGFENQEKLITILNGARVSELPLAVKNIVLTIFPNVATTEVVHAMKVVGSDTKPRIAIMVNGERKNLSVFMGNGNSVHQETLCNFLDYCKTELAMNEEEEVSLLRIMYGDGTLDGQSKAEERLPDTSAVKKEYPADVECAQSFFDKHKKELAERFLVYGKGGKVKNIKSDYIYYGTDVAGKILPYPLVIEHIIDKEGSGSALLTIGCLTSQPWNRNPKAKLNLESRRHSIQIKWGGMKQDIIEIASELQNNIGTAEGDWEEYELVAKLNRDKRSGNKLWSVLCQELNISNLDNVYAVRVSNTVYSKLSGRMVLPKADAYLVRGNINHQVLLDNNYWLDEDVIEGLEVKALPGSGISCKRPTSSSFTYAKLTVNSFETLFGSRELGAGISIFSKVSELHNNDKVLDGWMVSEEQLLEYFKQELDEANISDNERCLTNEEVCKQVKHAAIRETELKIRQSKEISNALFKGIGVFDEPYTANFIYINNGLTIAYVPDFSITTGSGRHRGNFTVVIKP